MGRLKRAARHAADRSYWALSNSINRSLYWIGAKGARRFYRINDVQRSGPMTQTFALTGAGLPLPPAKLMYLVTARWDVRWYVIGGFNAFEDIRAALDAVGTSIDQLQKVLDFGCGCGRAIRYWHGRGTEVHGTDYNRELIDWDREHLPFEFEVNGLDPPLSYESAQFDFIYALSVFTHLDERRQLAWRDELTRVLRPGGHLLITTHGSRWLPHLGPAEQEEFLAGGFIQRGEPVGSNLFAALHPEAYVRSKFATLELEVAGYFPWSALGQGGQDMWVFKKAQ